MISQIKKANCELNNLYDVFKIKTKKILTNKFIKIFLVVIIMIFPILFFSFKALYLQ